jgi:anaerobic ribonucleoside-triphosphate reductase activating protein
MKTLNVAEFCPSTRALGPGVRAALWVQGCPFRCPGCTAPEWQPFQGGLPVDVVQLANMIAALPVDGLTISGGEPMAQAQALVELVQLMRGWRPELNVICFTGYRLEQIEKYASMMDLMMAVDVLIDGPYVQALDNGIGLRGSTNQAILHISGRLAAFDLMNWPRHMELHTQPSGILVVGIPSAQSRAVENQLFEKGDCL